MKVVIVGAVAGGASVAARLRRIDEHAEIIMIDKGPYVSYANCGLPYYIGGVIEKREALFVASEALFRNRFKIDVRTLNELTKIDANKKEVTIHDHKKNIDYTESYDKLILSPGASPRKLTDANIEGMFTLRTVDDTFAIKSYIADNGVKKAVIVGAGFIGIEMAENLRHLGIDTTLLELSRQVMPPLDFEMARYVADELEKHGVKLQCGVKVEKIERNDATGELVLALSNGESLTTDLVLSCIGVAADTAFLADSGVELWDNGGILVDDQFKTSVDDIYAVGDAIVVRSFVEDAQVMIPLAGPANRQGRNLADILKGRKVNPMRVLGSAAVLAFDLSVAMTGWNERQLNRAGIAYRKVYVHPGSHAGYYPGANQMHMKLLYNREGKILGAQGVSHDDLVVKRIDVLATSMRLGATVYDLEELELCYAPPFSSAKDPVNMLGFVASNNLRGIHDLITCEEMDALGAEDQILDVRTERECSHGMIEGAKNIPVDVLRDHLDELDRDRVVNIYCRVGQRGYIAARILEQHGFKTRNLSGGWLTYASYRKACH